MLGRLPLLYPSQNPVRITYPAIVDRYLLCILSKVLEKYIFSLIVEDLEVYHPFSDCQWGFRPGRSTVTALLSIIHEWFQFLESGYDIGAIFLDYKKAFDSVPHAPLID